jgi:hypothetical protein
MLPPHFAVDNQSRSCDLNSLYCLNSKNYDEFFPKIQFSKADDGDCSADD